MRVGELAEQLAVQINTAPEVHPLKQQPQHLAGAEQLARELPPRAVELAVGGDDDGVLAADRRLPVGRVVAAQPEVAFLKPKAADNVFVVIGGQTLSLLLTLLVTPVAGRRATGFGGLEGWAQV